MEWRKQEEGAEQSVVKREKGGLKKRLKSETGRDVQEVETSFFCGHHQRRDKAKGLSSLYAAGPFCIFLKENMKTHLLHTLLVT